MSVMKFLLVAISIILLNPNLGLGQTSADLVATNYNDIVHLYNTEQTEEANYQIDSALKIYPTDPNFMNLKAIMVIYSGPVNDEKNDKIALELLNKAIEYDAERASYYNNRGWVYQFLDQYENAQKDFDKAAKLAPNSVDFLGNTLRIRWIRNRKKEALALANEIILKFPKDGYAYHVRGELKRDYLHKYLEGNKDKKLGKELGWNGGVHLIY